MIKKNNVEKEKNRYKTKTTGASLGLPQRSVIRDIDLNKSFEFLLNPF